MVSSFSVGNTEILQIADAVAREKTIDRDIVLCAMEDSIAIAARRKYGHDRSIKAEIDRKTGEIKLFRENEVVSDDTVFEEESEDSDSDNESEGKIILSEAKIKDADIKVGDILREPLPPIDLGRVAAQTAKQVIIQKVREAERERQYNDFKPRVGEIVHAVVKRVEFGNVVVDLGNAEAIMTKDRAIKGESFRVNERIRAYLEEVRREHKGPQIFLSRTSNEFMSKLFTQEVPEIYDGIIEIKSVAREPGSRAKVAVSTSDPSIDAVGSCVGIRGARVQAVINELQGEKIDIVQWSADPATFMINALSPAEVAKVVIDEDKNTIEAVVPDEQLSLAIGRRGQNVRLASKLIGWNIDVLTEADESKRRTEDFNRSSNMFIETLNIDEIIAHLLVSEGFGSVDEVAYVDTSELEQIEGFDENVANQLQQRARDYVEEKKREVDGRLAELGVEDELKSIEEVNSEELVKLAENGVKNLEDFAELTGGDFREILPNSNLTVGAVDELIASIKSEVAAREEGKEGEKKAS